MSDQISDGNARDHTVFDDFEPGERPYLPGWLRQQLEAGIAQGRAKFAERDAILAEQYEKREQDKRSKQVRTS